MSRSILFLLFFISIAAEAQYNNIYVETAWAERDKWQHPEWIMEAMGVEEGSTVADIGSHEGYMTVKFAQVVGTAGRVYAVDVKEERLDNLREILKERDIENVKLIHGDYDNPKTPKGKMDAILILDTYHEIEDFMVVLDHLKTSLKPDGRLVIIEPIADERASWSRDEQTRKHEISIRYVKEEVTEAGFKIVDQRDMFLDRTEEKGDKLWMLVLKKE